MHGSSWVGPVEAAASVAAVVVAGLAWWRSGRALKIAQAADGPDADRWHQERRPRLTVKVGPRDRPTDPVTLVIRRTARTLWTA